MAKMNNYIIERVIIWTFNFPTDFLCEWDLNPAQDFCLKNVVIFWSVFQDSINKFFQVGHILVVSGT